MTILIFLACTASADAMWSSGTKGSWEDGGWSGDNWRGGSWHGGGSWQGYGGTSDSNGWRTENRHWWVPDPDQVMPPVEDDFVVVNNTPPKAVSVPDAAEGEGASTSVALSVPDGAAEGKPKWPLTNCDACKEVGDWRDMHAKKTESQTQDGITVITWIRKCIPCVAKERNCTEQEAIAFILEECPGFRSKERRAAKFAKVREEAKVAFPSLTSYGELRDISLKMMVGLFSDFLDIFAVKAGHLDQLDQKLVEQRELIAAIKNASTSEEARELMLRLREVHERDELLAWKSRCTDPATGEVNRELQDRYIMASSRTSGCPVPLVTSGTGTSAWD